MIIQSVYTFLLDTEVIKQSFAAYMSLTVHWDGKILEEIIGCKKSQRLPTLVSGGGKFKTRGGPKKLCFGKGVDVANAVNECLEIVT